MKFNKNKINNIKIIINFTKKIHYWKKQIKQT